MNVRLMCFVTILMMAVIPTVYILCMFVTKLMSTFSTVGTSLGM